MTTPPTYHHNSRSPAAYYAALCLLTSFLASRPLNAAVPAMRVLHNSDGGISILKNGNFETGSDQKCDHWSAAPNGFSLAPGEGRTGSAAVRCESKSGAGWFGISQTIELNSTTASPLVIHGWSKAEDVSGSPDADYSLYVDLVYHDGTPLWGQTVEFRTGSHDWEKRELVIIPQRPVKSLTLHCLLRHHSGRVWFDDVSVFEMKPGNDALLFDGAPVLPVTNSVSRALPAAAQQSFKTEDGLNLSLTDGTVTSLQISGRELAANTPSGFLARDVAANSDIYCFAGNDCPDLGLKLRSQCRATKDHLVFEGRVSDITGKDRAITLIFALPVNGLGWQWGDDIRHARLTEGKEEFANLVSVRCGSTGTISQYPLACVSDGQSGLALALDMANPAVYRLAYNAGTKQFYIAFDFGLVPETRRFPSSADFRFVLYRFDHRWGFRAAFAKLLEIFPDYFRVRATEQGLWMPFTDISTVEGWQDFGFKFHEGNNNVAWDDAHGILSFRYTEPMTWWMRMAKELPRTMDAALRVRDSLADAPAQQSRQMARVAKAAGMFDESGQPSLLFRNEPWCDGAVWSLNPNPFLPNGASEDGHNAATVHWNETIRTSLYGPEAKSQLDGEYLDSLEGYVTAELNYRRDHFIETTVPLTFAKDTRKPALFKGLAVAEFTRWISDDVHRLGKLVFANGVPYRFSFLCPWLDVMGTETDWVSNGQYHPASDSQMNLWRTMSGGKPYLLLMNTDYNTFNSGMVEKYFQRSLFYGMFPGMFSHNAADNPYWQNPKWYNRDRTLFQQYLPIIKRVAASGWQPVTHAACDNPQVRIERFGPQADGSIFFTLLNDSTSPQKTAVQVDWKALNRLASQVKLRELISGRDLEVGAIQITLQPQGAASIEVR